MGIFFFASIKSGLYSVTSIIDGHPKMSPLGSSTRMYDAISRGNKVMIAKWQPSSIRHLEFLDILETLGKRRN